MAIKKRKRKAPAKKSKVASRGVKKGGGRAKRAKVVSKKKGRR